MAAVIAQVHISRPYADEKIIDGPIPVSYTHLDVYKRQSHMRAAVAQSVERRLGKAEVGGSIPLGSLIFRGLQEIISSESLFLRQKRRKHTTI